MIRDRALAAGAGLSVLAGAVVMVVGLVAAPGSWLAGYVSEAGTSGQPLALAYRSGLVLLALGVGLLGATIRQLTGALLAVAAVLAATSGVVPCSRGCPLPPFQPTTAGDVVHTAASIIGMVVLTGAMALCLRDPGLKRLAAAGVALMVPLGGALGLTMLFVGRGPLGAALERILLLVAVTWLIAAAALKTRPPKHNADPIPHPTASNAGST